MSTEDDVATIEAVTDALAGPLKVWVLQIKGDGADYIHLHRTIDGAAVMVKLDLEDNFSNPSGPTEIEALTKRFVRERQLTFRDTEYSVRHQEVKA